MIKYLFPGIKEGEYTAFIVSLCVMLVLWLLTAVARWRTYTKMGEAGWKAFIPLYGEYVLFAKCWGRNAGTNYVCSVLINAFIEAGLYGGSTGIVATLCMISELIFAIELLYLTVRINFRVAKSFGHGFWFGIGLWLLPVIFTFILGFGSDEYVGYPTAKAKADR